MYQNYVFYHQNYVFLEKIDIISYLATEIDLAFWLRNVIFNDALLLHEEK